MAETNTLGDRSRDRFGRWFASPASVLVILPLLVVAVGVVVLMLGRKATHDSAETLVRRQLVAQAIQVQRDVDFTLDQADPVLAGLRLLAEPALATPDAMQRLHDLVVGRPGIYNTSIAFPVGELWSTYKKGDQVLTAESRIDGDRTDYSFAGGMHEISKAPSAYDARTRPHYLKALEAKRRVWMEPRTFSTSHKTGLTVTEPVYVDGELVAVLTIDFDVESLSGSIGQPPIDGARTAVFTRDGAMLAYPSVPVPTVATAEQRVLQYTDYKDPRLDALFSAMANAPSTEQRFFSLDTSEGEYFASTAHLGANRAGSSAPVDWMLATLVPEHVLFDATRRLGRDAIIASAAALLIALGVALMFAWNLVRMRRTVVAARAEAKSARERAQELGSYRLVSKLGTGGMGEVWRAEHQLLARHAAIKLVRLDVLGDPAHTTLIQERFRREAQTLAALRSRNTIELYDYGVTDDGSFFFVMELLDGLDLSQLVREHGPQPAARVISIIAQACGSLAEAHDAGLLHRDIKPANLFLCRAADEVDIVKLLDFGIAHNVAEPVEKPVQKALELVTPKPGTTGQTDRLTVEGSVIGTPGYIPPEQAVGAPLDARGDLYALGCVAWWLLTGGEVYPGVANDDLIRTHVNEPIPDLRAVVRSWLPAELEQLIVQCLAKRPEDRPHDARALAEALTAIAIPAEHAWSKPMAIAWWKNLHVAATSVPEAVTMDAAVMSPRDQPTVIAKATPAIVVVAARNDDGPRTVTARPSGRIV
ncbi:MAG TPA: protein kinase [Kofleriaceae bacterium]